MKLDVIKDFVTSKTARQLLLAQKHSPKILFVAGTVGVVGATVLACRATLKVSDVLDQHEKVMADLTTIDREVGDKEVHKLQLKTGLEIAKLYAPAAVILTASVAALTGSHVILTKRNTGALAAYAAVDRAYKQYRENVIEKYGKEDDDKFASGARNVHIDEKMADGKTKTTVKSVVDKDGNRRGSQYAVLFDEKSKHFTPEPGMNPMVIGMIQQHMNDRLRMRGHVFLNEVYDRLDLPRTKAGQIVGWVYRNDGEEKTGDNFISFGLDETDERAEAFLDGHEKAVWLDFNVDGPVLDLI